MARPKKSKNAHEMVSFEEALGNLEKIVKELEKGELKLDESLETFAQGVAYSQICLTKLNAAEIQIDKILQKEKGIWKEKDAVFSGEGT